MLTEEVVDAPMEDEQSAVTQREANVVSDDGLLRYAVPRRNGAVLEAAARRMMLGLGVRGQGGAIEVTEAGRTSRLGTGEPVVQVSVHDPRVYGALLRSGSVGLGASYVAGWWDADDLTALVRVLFRWTRPLRARLDEFANAVGVMLDLPARFGAPGRFADRRNVQAHYDLSNEFFELMLDETMTYSCAVFENPTSTLRDAQMAKIDRLCAKLELRPKDRVVEIGTGWGGFALHAAQHYGCRVTTTTISEAQRAYAVERVTEAGLADRITILGDDWRDLAGEFDKLVSIEMIEAVDWRHHDQFVAKCAALLVEDGLAVVQAIVIDDHSFERAKRHQDFVRRMVFPGGCIPSVESLATSLARATDLRMIDLEDIGNHYAETLKRWSENLEAHAQDVERLGARTEFRRLWALYLAYCEASFRERHVSDVQLVLAKPAWRGALHARP
jgi:cyclopropane-fatty-acyl-phospholipid synthase